MGITGKDYKEAILYNKQIAKDTFELKVAYPGPAPAPGQFAQLAPPSGGDILLRRPISINFYDAKEAALTFVYKVLGEGTRRLSRLRAGDTLTYMAPLGVGFTAVPGAKILLIGAGIGCAPLRYVPAAFPENTFVTLLAFRGAEYVYQQDAYPNVHICTDDGSAGEKAYAAQAAARLVREFAPTQIMACGPEIVLKGVQELALKEGIAAQLSLEERMGCGVGACMVCACRVKRNGQEEHLRCCADGPVFPAEEVVFRG